MDENVPEQSAGVKPQRPVVPPKQVVYGEAAPAFAQEGFEDLPDYEFFGSAANFRPIGQQIRRNQQQQQTPKQAKA